jgi:hypothetical protein
VRDRPDPNSLFLRTHHDGSDRLEIVRPEIDGLKRIAFLNEYACYELPARVA